MKSSLKVTGSSTVAVKMDCIMYVRVYAAVGAVCHLYFDIEFNIAVNPDTVGVAVLETFVEV